MKVILNQDVYNLGEEGDVCEVARGYARNYLIPKKFAVPFNAVNRAIFESKKAVIEKRKESKRKAALSLKEKIEEMKLELKMSAGDSGKLFGAVTSATISDALAKEGIEVERKKIEIESSSLKMLGTHLVRVKLYENEVAELTVVIEDDRKKAVKEEAPPPKAEKPIEQAPAEEPAEEPAVEAEAEEEEKDGDA